MSNIVRNFSFCLLLLFAFACAGQPLNTASRKPEVTIANTTKKEVTDYLTNAMINRGYQMKQVNDYILTFGKRNEGILVGLLMGSRYDTVPENRVGYNIVENAQGVRVIATLQMITNPGSAFERVNDFSTSSKDAHSFQTIMETMKQELEAKK